MPGRARRVAVSSSRRQGLRCWQPQQIVLRTGDACCIYTDWTSKRDVSCTRARPFSWGHELELRCEHDNKLTRFAAMQRQWLEGALESSTADWKVVIGHCAQPPSKLATQCKDH